ncbi:magnesium transporter [Haloarchaeobius sp. FL176]|uniref:magnesium transporter n=1 Tax=Haloarchaeobius sp. FL176 TaxID=2967129 RepID=UPI0021488472
MPERWSVRSISRAMLPLLLVLSLVELGSGLVLGSFEDELLRRPSLLVLVPVTIGTAGNLGSILAARLSTAVHLGTITFSPEDDTLVGNAVATAGLAVSVFPVVGLGAWGLTELTVGATLAPTRVVLVAACSGAVLAVLAIAVTLLTTYVAYRLGLDPDDVVIPVVTNTCDVLGVLVLFGVVLVLL